MINPAEFAEGEFDASFAKLTELSTNSAALDEEVMKYFAQYDDDANASLDRRELRGFLNNFFSAYHIHVPITDEYVDGVFRQIDINHDNKLQPEELKAFAKLFIGKLVVAFQAAAAGQATTGGFGGSGETGEEEKKE